MWENEIKTIIGIDVGDTAGVSLIKLNNLEIVDNPVFTEVTYKGKKDEFFYYNVAKEIEKFIGYWAPDLVFMEGYAFGKGFFNVHQPEITAQVKRFMVDSNIPFCELHISNMRKVVLDNGKATKAEARAGAKMFFRQLGYSIPKFDDLHVYDSCIPLIHGYMYVKGMLREEDRLMVKQSIVGG